MMKHAPPHPESNVNEMSSLSTVSCVVVLVRYDLPAFVCWLAFQVVYEDVYSMFVSLLIARSNIVWDIVWAIGCRTM